MELTPLNVSSALNVPGFYLNKGQFWHMIEFLFTQYNEKTVWSQLPQSTYSNMGIQLHQFVESLDSEVKLIEKIETLYQTFFVIMRMTRYKRTVSEWYAYSSPEFLDAMYKMYRLMFSMQGVPKLPLFGHTLP